MTSSHRAPYTLGYTRATLGKTKSCEFGHFIARPGKSAQEHHEGDIE